MRYLKWLYAVVSLLFSVCGIIAALDAAFDGGSVLAAAGYLLGGIAFGALVLGEDADERRERERYYE